MTPDRLARSVGLAGVVGASVLTYFGAARVLRLRESTQAWRMIAARLPGGLGRR